jgi:HTH-type transcriptional regulator/antitoxin HigA
VQSTRRITLHVALVDIYEAKRWPIEIDETFDPIDVLQCAIGELSHSQAELAELLGSHSRASEVLSRRRALTVEMIHKIGEGWKIPADLLVRPYKVERAAYRVEIRFSSSCAILDNRPPLGHRPLLRRILGSALNTGVRNGMLYK